MAQVVEPTWIGGLPGLEPGLARLSALPNTGGVASDLPLDAAALERAGENVSASRRDRDRAAAHRAGIVYEQRHRGVTERHVLLLLEGQRLLRIEDHTRQARCVENAFFEIELPRTALLRH